MMRKLPLQWKKDVNFCVDQFFKDKNISPKGNFHLVVKFVIFLSLFALFYTIVLFSNGFNLSLTTLVISCAALAFSIAGLGFNILHEAAHGALSRHRFVNKMGRWLMECAGFSSYLYQISHCRIHHHHTNVYGVDGDISDVDIVRLSPKHPWKPVHRYQVIYTPFLYSLLTLVWVWWSDFVRIVTKTVGREPIRAFPPKVLFKILINKCLHACLALVVPSLFLGFSKALFCYFVTYMFLGCIFAFVFQLAHTHSTAEWPDKNADNFDAFENQFLTAANFAVSNSVVSWLLGGLNFQLEHHMSPHISHVHYPQISKIVKNICLKYGINYPEVPSMRKAIFLHFHWLYQMGQNKKHKKLVKVHT